MTRATAPLRHRGFAFLASGQLASNVGDACYIVALPWYVLAGHGGPLLLGIVLVAYGVPRTALLAIGGHASDRWRPWTVMLASDCVRAAALAGLALAAALGPVRVAVIVPIAIVVGAGEGFFLPSSFAIVPALLPAEELQSGNAVIASGTQLATLAGPPLAGLLIAVSGPGPAFVIDAATFVVSALTLLGVGTSQRRAAHPELTAPAPDGQSQEPAAATTLRALLRNEPVLLIILLVTVAANLGAGGLTDVALPALVHSTLRAGAGYYGLLVAAIAVGSLIGTMIAGKAPTPRRPVIIGSCAFLVQAAALAIAPYPHNVPALGAALLVFGLSNGFANVLMLTTFQRWAPPSLLGRATGLLLLASFGVFPLSAALAGVVVQDAGPATFFPVAGAILAVAILTGLGQRRWRAFGSSEAAPPESAVADNSRAV